LKNIKEYLNLIRVSFKSELKVLCGVGDTPPPMGIQKEHHQLLARVLILVIFWDFSRKVEDVTVISTKASASGFFR